VNTLKPLLIVAVLAGIGYGVYVRINNGSDAPPPDGAKDWDTAPQVQMPDGAASSAGPWTAGGPTNSGMAPTFDASRTAPAAVAVPRGPDAPPNNPPSAVPPYAQGNPPAPPANDPAAGAPPVAVQQPPDVGQANAYPNYPPAAAVPGQPPAATPGRYDAPADDRNRAPVGVADAPSSAPGFAAAVETARRELEAGQLASALKQLSGWYDDPRLSPTERQQLIQLLDQVAGTVVYSTQHLLESPYEVQPGERLEDIAQRYNIPWQLLAKINGIDDPQNLRAGERLKVMKGPFSAVVSLEKRQLTLLLADGSYAGRFSIGIGVEHPPQEGSFAVSDKVVNPVYHGRDRAVGAGDTSNPLGDRWIGLGSDLGIHGTNRAENIGRTDLSGSISLSRRDVEDVFDILSVGSRVVIRR
jgi:LysM repeat protein